MDTMFSGTLFYFSAGLQLLGGLLLRPRRD
jgi:hypothetical protein